MRQNPYGSRKIPNPDRDRICMTDDDPCQYGAFPASRTLGLVTAIGGGTDGLDARRAALPALADP